MIDKKLIPVGGLKKEPFSGSHDGMRYFFRCDESKETFSVFVYPEPWSFDRTPDGMDEAISWLFSIYESQKDRWQNAKKNCMHVL